MNGESTGLLPMIASMRLALIERRGVIMSGMSSLLLRLAGLGASFLLGVVLARTLGPTQYGIYGLVISIGALAMNFALLGTPQLAVRELAVRSSNGDWMGAKGLVRSFGRATMLASLAIGLIGIGAAVIFAPGDRDILIYCAIGAGLCATTASTALIAAELRGIGALFKGQFMDIFGRPAATFVLVGLLLLGGIGLNAASALVIQLVVSAIAAIISLWWINRAIADRTTAAETPIERGWFRQSLPLGVVDVLRQFDGSYGMILMGWLASGSDLGVYRVALACGVLIGMPATIVHIVMAPTVSRHFRFGEREELQRLLRFASGLMVAIMVPMLLALLIAGRPLIELVFGAVYGEAWLPLVLLCVAQLGFGLFGMGPILLAMADSERHLTKIYLIAVGSGVLLAIPLVWRFGAVGAAGAQIVSTGLIAYLSGRFARRKLGLGTTFMTGGLSEAPPAGA